MTSTLSHNTADERASVLSVAPVVIPAAERGDDLQVRVTAPAVGTELSLVVFSHGFGSSMNGYAPLVQHWAGLGFAVIQPTHLDSRTLDLAADDPRTPQIWRTRIDDLTRVLDELDLIERSVPGLAGRLDHERIAVAGHSWGATTASALAGARVIGPGGEIGPSDADPRIKAALLFAVAGTGGDDLTPFAAENFAFMNPEFSEMTTPALLVAGDADQSPLTTRGPDWWTDAYRLSPAPKSLLTLPGAEHSMGGIPGYNDPETTDENPERVALLQRVSTAYLRHVFHLGDERWTLVQAQLADETASLGRIESK